MGQLRSSTVRLFVPYLMPKASELIYFYCAVFFLAIVSLPFTCLYSHSNLQVFQNV